MRRVAATADEGHIYGWGNLKPGWGEIFLIFFNFYFYFYFYFFYFIPPPAQHTAS